MDGGGLARQSRWCQGQVEVVVCLARWTAARSLAVTAMVVAVKSGQEGFRHLMQWVKGDEAKAKGGR